MTANGTEKSPSMLGTADVQPQCFAARGFTQLRLSRGPSPASLGAGLHALP